MAFTVRNLSVLAYTNGFTSWHYKALDGDTSDSISQPSFFESAKEMLASGDLITATGNGWLKQLVVKSDGTTGSVS